jgi:hypothetical protein
MEIKVNKDEFTTYHGRGRSRRTSSDASTLLVRQGVVTVPAAGISQVAGAGQARVSVHSASAASETRSAAAAGAVTHARLSGRVCLVQSGRRQVSLLIVRARAAVKLAEGAGGLALHAAMSTLELIKGLYGEGGGLMVDGLGVMGLMDRGSPVDDVTGSSLLLNHGLDMLVNMVVNVLASDDRGVRGGVGSLMGDGGVLEGCSVLLKPTAGLSVILVVKLAVLHRVHNMARRFGEDLLVLHRLDARLVVVLVNFFVHSGGHVLMLMRVDVLLSHGATDVLVYRRLVLAVLGQEACSCLLGLLHFEFMRLKFVDVGKAG